MPRLETYDSNGNLVSVTDDRTVTACAAAAVARVKRQCQEAIEATGLPWMAQREISGGTAIPQDVKDTCSSLRQQSNELETQLETLVANAADDNDKDTCDLIESLHFT